MLENFWLEYQVSGQGVYALNCTFQDAMQQAFDMCISDNTVVNVFNGHNKKIAQQTLRGAKWVTEAYR